MSAASKNPQVLREEHHVESTTENAEALVGFEAHQDQLPKGYFYSRFFLGTYFAIGFSLWAGVAAL